MGTANGQPGKPLVVGANHRSSSLTLRDRLFIEDKAVPAFLGSLRRAGIGQAVVISTCDRVEVQAYVPDPDTAGKEILAVFADTAGVQPYDLAGQIYHLQGDEAIRHIFAVAASLDSLVVGEPQVLGQVKACHRIARDCDMVGAELETLMQAAFATAKKVRSDTRIGEGPVSIAAAAVQTARDLYGDIGRCRALLIGAGDMGQLVGENLKSAGLADLSVTHPTRRRTEGIAKALDGEAIDFENMAAALNRADIVLTALNTREHVLSADMVNSALKVRKRKPVFIVDTGIPGDVEPAVDRIDEAFLYDLNDLERVAMRGRATREAEARAARNIVAGEVVVFLRGRAERTAVPTVTALRTRFDAVRDQALAEAGGDAERATRLLVNRLLHDPSEELRAMASRNGAGVPEMKWRAAEAMLRRLFRLHKE